MEITDLLWQLQIGPGHVNLNVVQVMQSILSSNIPDWLGYIYIQVVFKLAIACRGYLQDLERDR